MDRVGDGLAGDVEFLADMDMALQQHESSCLFEIFQTGDLLLNNEGRIAKTIRASALLPLPKHVPLISLVTAAVMRSG